MGELQTTSNSGKRLTGTQASNISAVAGVVVNEIALRAVLQLVCLDLGLRLAQLSLVHCLIYEQSGYVRTLVAFHSIMYPGTESPTQGIRHPLRLCPVLDVSCVPA